MNGIENKNRKTIAGDIHDAHSRIARQYGLLDLDGRLPVPSYSHWNLDRNVYRPLRAILNRYFDEKAEWFCDAGCGNGQFTAFLCEHAAEKVIGVDFSEAMLRTAAERSQRAGRSGRFFPVLSRLEDLACLRKESIDGIFLFGVVEHLDDPVRVVSSLAPALSKGGCLIMSVPLRFSTSYWSFLFFGQSPRRWGLKIKLRDAVNFKDKLKYYRFYNRKLLRRILNVNSDLEAAEIIPFVHSHVEGKPAAVLHKIGAMGKGGYKMLDFLEMFFRIVWPVPGAEYWVLRKTK